MPYAVEFPIATSDHPPPPNLYRALYANLLRWMDAAYPGLGDVIHGRLVRKPFTLSALRQDRDGDWRFRLYSLFLRAAGSRATRYNLNFSHPLAPKQLQRIGGLSGQGIESKPPRLTNEV